MKNKLLQLARHEMFYSAYNQDVFVNGLLDGKENGVFIDVGACEGIYVSNTYFFEKHKGWKGICIEADPKTFEDLKENRPNSICVNSLIYDYREIHKYAQDEIPQFSGIETERTEKTKEYNSIQLKSELLNDVMEKYKIYNIDFLSLDTEGCETRILDSIDYDKFNIVVRLGGDLILAKNRKDKCKYFQERQYFGMEKRTTVNER